MKPNLSLVFSLACCTLAQAIAFNSASAQVTPDGTTDTNVSTGGNDLTIQQGDKAGSNLFHSFRDFNVPNRHLQK